MLPAPHKAVHDMHCLVLCCCCRCASPSAVQTSLPCSSRMQQLAPAWHASTPHTTRSWRGQSLATSLTGWQQQQLPRGSAGGAGSSSSWPAWLLARGLLPLWTGRMLLLPRSASSKHCCWRAMTLMLAQVCCSHLCKPLGAAHHAAQRYAQAGMFQHQVADHTMTPQQPAARPWRRRLFFQQLPCAAACMLSSTCQPQHHGCCGTAYMLARPSPACVCFCAAAAPAARRLRR